MTRDQEQFLDVVDRDEAERRFRAAVDASPRGIQSIPLDAALGRVLARDVVSPVDVPSFDRANVDGYAVVAADTFGASEVVPRVIALSSEVIHTGIVPAVVIQPGEAAAIATGGMMPRGADAVVMVEYADTYDGGSGIGDRGSGIGDQGSGIGDQGSGIGDQGSGTGAGDSGLGLPPVAAEPRRGEPRRGEPRRGGFRLHVSRAVAPGSGVSFAGTDITRGETVLRRGQVLTSRDTGVLAAIGVAHVDVWRRPVVAILSTGDEIISPGEPMAPARVFDSNAQILADAVRELGGEPLRLGIVRDDMDALHAKLQQALAAADIVLLSGGTSKGAGDVSYRVVSGLPAPGIVAHGVALKPGKPICLASAGGKPVVVLPGFPTSAIFTFHEFVAPVIASMAGRTYDARSVVQAKLAVKVNSEIGRTEYLLVGLVESPDPSTLLRVAQGRPERSQRTNPESRLPNPESLTPVLTAYPMGQGSGSVTTFSRADGFTTIARHEEIVPAGTVVDVQLLGRDLQLADLVVIGSHCIGLDYLLGELQQQGVRTKFIAVGSTAGLEAAKRGECDLAGVHLLDPESGSYNEPFLTPGLQSIRGYGRLQGIVFRRGDMRFEGRTATDAVAAAVSDAGCIMINRNQGSGTRVLIDRLLSGARPPGYAVQPRNHNAVAAGVAQSRADWGITLDHIAAAAGLGFIPVQQEQFDFVVPEVRGQREAVARFRELLQAPATRETLGRLGMRL
jgi:putative molybdopterin biosynthesis protein